MSELWLVWTYISYVIELIFQNYGYCKYLKKIMIGKADIKEMYRNWSNTLISVIRGLIAVGLRAV